MTTFVRKIAVIPPGPLESKPNTCQTTPVIATPCIPPSDPATAGSPPPPDPLSGGLAAPLPPLSERDESFLEPLLQSDLDFHALAKATNLSLLALYRWASQPHIAAYIDFHRAAAAEHDRAQARAETRAALRLAADPAEKRRLIALLLRATERRPARPADARAPRRPAAARNLRSNAPGAARPVPNINPAEPTEEPRIDLAPDHLPERSARQRLAQIHANIDALAATGDPEALSAYLAAVGPLMDHLEDAAEDEALDNDDDRDDDQDDDDWGDDDDPPGPAG
jgi:hypothetical protein